MKAMLLAAGAGSRLKPLTDTIPKPLAPIANVPLLERTVDWLASEGVDEIIINVHHHADQIVGAIGNGRRFGTSIAYSYEEQLLGTSGAVRRCWEQLKSEPFYVIYGDNLIDAGLTKLYDFHLASKAAATIALFVPDDPSASGMVEVGDNGNVQNFIEKPRLGESSAIMANAGIYVIDPTLVACIPEGFSDFGRDMFPQWLGEGLSIFALPLDGYLQDTGTLERYRKANWDVLTGGLRYQGRGTRNGFALIGTETVLAPSAELIGRNIIAEQCSIGVDSTLSDCIVWRCAEIGAGCRLTNVIVGEGAALPAGTELAGCAVI